MLRKEFESHTNFKSRYDQENSTLGKTSNKFRKLALGTPDINDYMDNTSQVNLNKFQSSKSILRLDSAEKPDASFKSGSSPLHMYQDEKAT